MTARCALPVPFPPGCCTSLAPAASAGHEPGLRLRVKGDIDRERFGAMGSWVVKEVQSLCILRKSGDPTVVQYRTIDCHVLDAIFRSSGCTAVLNQNLISPSLSVGGWSLARVCQASPVRWKEPIHVCGFVLWRIYRGRVSHALVHSAIEQ